MRLSNNLALRSITLRRVGGIWFFTTRFFFLSFGLKRNAPWLSLFTGIQYIALFGIVLTASVTVEAAKSAMSSMITSAILSVGDVTGAGIELFNAI